MYLTSVVLLLIVANLSSVATFCDVNGDYQVGSESSFQEMVCNFEHGSSEWPVAKVNFPSHESANVKVTCTTINDNTELYTKLHKYQRSNMYIKIPKSAVDLDMINGAKCSIEGCYESDVYNRFKIPTSSCIVDFDECSEGNHNCPSDAKCENTPRGSYTCVCLAAGYTFNSTPSLCLDIDECLTNNSICAGYGPNALCINTNGSYECGCADGYRLNNGVHCDNIDECTVGTHNCSSNAECTDTDGSYYCNCTEDFQGDGQFYEDITVVTDDSAIFADLVSTLAVLSLVLLVVMTVFFTLCVIFVKLGRRNDYSTPKWKPQESTTTIQDNNYVSTA